MTKRGRGSGREEMKRGALLNSKKLKYFRQKKRVDKDTVTVRSIFGH